MCGAGTEVAPEAAGQLRAAAAKQLRAAGWTGAAELGWAALSARSAVGCAVVLGVLAGMGCRAPGTG